MSYSKLLKKYVAESGYTNKEIIEECHKRGRKIDKAYFSKLLNGKVPAPSEELSRLLSDICNVDDRYLVLEGYLDKAPKEVKEAFIEFEKMVYMSSMDLFENVFTEELYKQLDESFSEQPLSEFVISLIEEGKNMQNINEIIQMSVEGNNYNINLQEPVSIPISDNGMLPKILENSKVKLTIQDKYNDFDIVAVKIKKTEDIIARFCKITDDEITLIPLNKQYETKIYKPQDIVILGKITKVIMDI